MKYLCLVYGDEQKLANMPDAHCVAFDEEVRKSGHCIASEALQPVSTATTVRVRNGKLSVTDGPFAETKEKLAGFDEIEARELLFRFRERAVGDRELAVADANGRRGVDRLQRFRRHQLPAFSEAVAAHHALAVGHGTQLVGLHVD